MLLVFELMGLGLNQSLVAHVLRVLTWASPQRVGGADPCRPMQTRAGVHLDERKGPKGRSRKQKDPGCSCEETWPCSFKTGPIFGSEMTGMNL